MLIISTALFKNESMKHVAESSSRSLGLFNVSITGNFNPFHATGFFLYPLETSENLWLTGAFQGLKKSAFNGLINTEAYGKERKEDLLPSYSA